MREYEDVTGEAPCAECGATTGTIWKENPSGSTYRIPPHGRMGNKSYRDDDLIGEYCASPLCKEKKE